MKEDIPSPSHPRSNVAKLGAKINRSIDKTKEARIKVKRCLNGSLIIYSLENKKILAEINSTVSDIIILFWSINRS